MPTTKKIFAVQNLAEKFKQAKALILTDFSGLNVSQITELRRKIKKAGGEFEVVKNTLLMLAAENSKLQISNSKLEGPSAALWIYSEDFAPLKALDQFIRQTQLPKIKFGFWEGKEISEERIKEIANLPDISELQARVIFSLQSPIFRLISDLENNLRKLIFLLEAVKNKNAGGGEN